MFNPRLLDIEAPGIAEMAFNAIQVINAGRALLRVTERGGHVTLRPVCGCNDRVHTMCVRCSMHAAGCGVAVEACVPGPDILSVQLLMRLEARSVAPKPEWW